MNRMRHSAEGAQWQCIRDGINDSFCEFCGQKQDTYNLAKNETNVENSSPCHWTLPLVWVVVSTGTLAHFTSCWKLNSDTRLGNASGCHTPHSNNRRRGLLWLTRQRRAAQQSREACPCASPARAPTHRCEPRENRCNMPFLSLRRHMSYSVRGSSRVLRPAYASAFSRKCARFLKSARFL